MAIISLGGVHWDPLLVGWGKLGRPQSGENSAKEMLGYNPRKEGRGKLSDDERQRRVVDVWDCAAVYALFERGRCVYIGEGKLGDRLEKHWKTDNLSGRWDAFSWLSPWEYSLPNAGKAEIAAKDDNYAENIRSKELVELLELVAIRLGSPEANAQLPKSEQSILWLNQWRSNYSRSTIEEKVDEVLKLIKENGEGG